MNEHILKEKTILYSISNAVNNSLIEHKCTNVHLIRAAYSIFMKFIYF